MSTLCKTYSDEGEAREAVQRLLAAGTPRREHPTADGLAAARRPRGARRHLRRIGRSRRAGRDASPGARGSAARAPAPSPAIPIASARAASPMSTAT